MTKVSQIYRLLRFLWPSRGGVTQSILLGTLTIAASTALMATSAWLISKAALQPGIETLGLAVVGVRAFGISRAVFRYLERLVSHDVTFRLLASIRIWFYRSIEPIAPAGLSKYQSGDLLSRVVGDVESLQEFYIRAVAPVFVSILTMLSMLIFFAFFDILLSVVAFFAMVAAGTLITFIAWWRTQKPGQERIQKRAELNALMVDSLQGMADSIAYGYDEHQLHIFRQLNDALGKQEQQLIRLDALQIGAGLLATHITSILILWLAIPRVDGIYLATLALATVAAFEAITPLAAAAVHLGSSLGAAERVLDIVDNVSPIDTPMQKTNRMSPISHTLDLQNVSFRYDEHLPLVLNQVNLHVEAGQKIAIVGPSGAGKSSIANILLRFWGYSDGTITIGDQDLRTVSQDSIHQQIALMSQRTHLFNTTIRENIAIARQNATPDDVIAAAKRANIHTFIRTLPGGYDTVVGEFGTKLSGGERQRIALARVLLKDAPIILLDEPTANLDAVTERAILTDLFASITHQTLILITHRLTLLDMCDQIYVLKQGQLIEHGTQTELLNQDSYFQSMWNSQHTRFVV